MMAIAESFFFAVGIIVVLAAVWKIVKSVAMGKIPEAVKTGVGSFIVAALMFNISIPISLAQGLGNLVTQVVDVVQNIVDGEDDPLG